MGAAYTLAELRRIRAAREANPAGIEQQPPDPDPPSFDAPMDEGIVLGCWNGERFVSWSQWRAAAPIETEPGDRVPAPADASCLTAQCGSTRIWLVRDGDRWRMHAGSRGHAGRRRDFASPFLEHAMRTAEQWYGQASGRWREERKKDARNPDEDSKAADPNVYGEDGEPLLARSGRD